MSPVEPFFSFRWRGALLNSVHGVFLLLLAPRGGQRGEEEEGEALSSTGLICLRTLFPRTPVYLPLLSLF